MRPKIRIINELWRFFFSTQVLKDEIMVGKLGLGIGRFNFYNVPAISEMQIYLKELLNPSKDERGYYD